MTLGQKSPNEYPRENGLSIVRVFFSRFKDEWKSTIAEIETFEELQEFVSGKIRYYNEERLHTSISLEKPLEVTKSCLKKEKNSSVK